MVDGRTGGPTIGLAPPLGPRGVPQASSPGAKSPIGAAALNFFFPGLGYVYVGLGRDRGEIVFGALVFVFYFIGFDVGYLIAGITYTPSAPVSVSPYAALILLALLLPFAFAYDGYRRARSP